MADLKEFERPDIIDVDPSEIREVSAVDERKYAEGENIPEVIDSTVPEPDKEYGTDQTEAPINVESQEAIKADIFIKTITPYKITFSKKDNRDIAIIIYLCRDDYDNLFIIDRNIVIKNEDHMSNLECIPFAECKECDFINDKICTQLMMGHLDNYICDMKFSISKEDIKNSDPVMRTTLTNVKTREVKEAAISADTFTALKFIDTYIEENIINEHDLALAVVAGSKDNQNKMVEFFIVDSIEKIVAMAPAMVELKEKKSIWQKIKDFITGAEEVEHSTSVGMVIKVGRYNGQEKEIVQLLTPFDIGVEFDEDKFKGNTISSIEENYYGDADQYVTTLTINSVEIGDIDKTFMMIRAKAKTGAIKLFMLDYSIQKELQDMINEY